MLVHNTTWIFSYPLFLPVASSIGIRTEEHPLKAFIRASSVVPYHRFFTNSIEVAGLAPLVAKSAVWGSSEIYGGNIGIV